MHHNRRRDHVNVTPHFTGHAVINNGELMPQSVQPSNDEEVRQTLLRTFQAEKDLLLQSPFRRATSVDTVGAIIQMVHEATATGYWKLTATISSPGRPMYVGALSELIRGLLPELGYGEVVYYGDNKSNLEAKLLSID